MQFVFSKVPTTVEEFKGLENFSLKQPHSTAALFLLALCRYVEDQPTGIAMINILKGPVSLSKHEESFLWDRFYDKLYLPYAYFNGATPENNYTPAQPLTIEVYDDTLPPQEEGYVRVFFHTVGADSKRAVTLRKKGEDYFLWDYPAIVSGIRKPAKEDPWS